MGTHLFGSPCISWLRLRFKIRLLFVFTHSYFNCLGVPQVEEKMKYIKYKNQREYTKHLSNLIWKFFYKQRSYHEEISEKQQSQFQKIQRMVTSGNITQKNGNINNFWKWQLLVVVLPSMPEDLLLFFTTRINKNGCL